jgi:uncharacterized membrane protein required for colicin V production
MVLDLLSLICVVGYGLLGVRRGAAYQIVRLLSLLGSLYISRRLAPVVGTTTGNFIGVDGLPSQIVAFAVIAIAAYILLRLILYPIHALLSGAGDELSTLNRTFGGIFATLMATAFIYTVISSTLVLNARFGDPLQDSTLDPSQSNAASLCAQYNLLGALQIPHKEALRALAQAKIREEQGIPHEGLPRGEIYADLLHHEKAEFLNDPSLVQAILDDRWSRVIAEPSVWIFLTDPDVVDTILATTQMRGGTPTI